MASLEKQAKYAECSREQLINALIHVADEIKGQVECGSLQQLRRDSRHYWLQVAECAVDPSFLMGNNPKDIAARKERERV